MARGTFKSFVTVVLSALLLLSLDKPVIAQSFLTVSGTCSLGFQCPSELGVFLYYVFVSDFLICSYGSTSSYNTVIDSCAYSLQTGDPVPGDNSGTCLPVATPLGCANIEISCPRSLGDGDPLITTVSANTGQLGCVYNSDGNGQTICYYDTTNCGIFVTANGQYGDGWCPGAAVIDCPSKRMAARNLPALVKSRQAKRTVWHGVSRDFPDFMKVHNTLRKARKSRHERRDAAD